VSEAFGRRNGELCAEAVALREIAERVGTPVYVYSKTTLVERYTELDAAFTGVPHLICYAIKANMNLAVVRSLVVCGAGVDITAGGELYRARRAGADPQKIVYSGVGKTAAEIEQALDAGIKLFNVESRAELRRIDAVAAARGVVAPIAFRVNPDVDPKTHPYISTGLRTSKFGIPMEEALAAYAEAKTLEHVRPVGVGCHIGSQLIETAPFADALARVRELVRELRAAGHCIEVIDAGGGLGVRYRDETPPPTRQYADAVLGAVGDLACELILEPGRWLVADAGVLVTRVLYEKKSAEKHFIIVDAAMNDLLRPALYEAHHAIETIAQPRSGNAEVDVVGPVCESGDFLARGRALPPLEAGDLLAVRSAGAYGFAMASNYNGRRRPAEVLVHGARYAVVRERESYEDLARGENLGEELET